MSLFVKNMQYPLQEKIGKPELLVGREKEFKNFHKWIANIPGKLSKSRVILARKKSGKTAFIQRLFNELWSSNGEVIPFFFDIGENKAWYPNFAIDYFCAFATQYISFMERDPSLADKVYPLEKLNDYAVKKSINIMLDDIKAIQLNRADRLYDSIWKIAYSAPHRFAAHFNKRFLVIIDEFQNITQYIYRDEDCSGKPDKTLAGSFHYHVESKIAPMLVTGSYVGWLININSKYLEAGRLSEFYISPYLTCESGLEAVYRYAHAFNESITNETAMQINTLCMSDPFFISCVIQSSFEDKDISTQDGVVDTINYEITNRYSEMSRTWGEYIQLTLHKINDRNAKNMLLFLSKNSDRYWTPKEIKDALDLDLSLNEIQKKLLILVEADVLEWGNSDIDFRGLQDGTLNLILRSRFEKEISGFEPDFKSESHIRIKQLEKEKATLQGMLNKIKGEVAEMQLAAAFRSKKRFKLSRFFKMHGVDSKISYGNEGCDTNEGNNVNQVSNANEVSDANDIMLNIVDVRNHILFQREDGKNMELDVVVKSFCGRVLIVEVKKRAVKTGITMIEDFYEKIDAYRKLNGNALVIPAFLSLGGFTKDAETMCSERGIYINDSAGHQIGEFS